MRTRRKRGRIHADRVLTVMVIVSILSTVSLQTFANLRTIPSMASCAEHGRRARLGLCRQLHAALRRQGRAGSTLPIADCVDTANLSHRLAFELQITAQTITPGRRNLHPGPRAARLCNGGDLHRDKASRNSRLASGSYVVGGRFRRPRLVARRHRIKRPGGIAASSGIPRGSARASRHRCAGSTAHHGAQLFHA
jgi:hypothetical protein